MRLKTAVVAFGLDGHAEQPFLSFYRYNKDILSKYTDIIDGGIVKTYQDAARALEILENGRYDAVVPVILTSVEPPIVYKVLEKYIGLPMLLWCVTGKRENGMLVTSAPFGAASALMFPLKRMGADKLFFLHDHSGGHKAETYAAQWFSALRAAVMLRNSRIGMLGSSDFGFYTGMFDPVVLRGQIGPEVIPVELYEISSLMDRTPDAVIRDFAINACKWDGTDSIPTEVVERTARLKWALERKVESEGLTAFTISCFSGVAKHLGLVPCIAVSLLADTMDFACKCDMPALISMIALHGITGEPSTYLELYDIVDGRLFAANCGMTPSKYVDGCRRIWKFQWGDWNGMMDISRRREGRITLFRIAPDGNRHLMHYMSADAVRPGHYKEYGWDDPSPAFPALELDMGNSLDYFTANTLGQHYACSQGDHTKELDILRGLLKL